MQRYDGQRAVIHGNVRYRKASVEIGELGKIVGYGERVTRAVLYPVLGQRHYARIVLAVRIAERIEQITAVIIDREHVRVLLERREGDALVHLVASRRVVVHFLNYGYIGILRLDYRRRARDILFDVSLAYRLAVLALRLCAVAHDAGVHEERIFGTVRAEPDVVRHYAVRTVRKHGVIIVVVHLERDIIVEPVIAANDVKKIAPHGEKQHEHHSRDGQSGYQRDLFPFGKRLFLLGLRRFHITFYRPRRRCIRRGTQRNPRTPRPC